jgi:ureidoacrylate peracid hydrolase
MASLSSPSSRVVELEARPSRVAFDLAHSAALVVDMQNDFGAKGGMFDRAGLDISGIRAAVQPTARSLSLLRGAGVPIVYLKMGYRPDLSDLGVPGSPNRERHLAMSVGASVSTPTGQLGRVLVRDSWGTEIVPELAPHPGDVVVYKTRFSGFFATELDSILRGLGVTTLIVAGCTTSVCVESTIRDAMFRDYRCVLLSDCSAEPIGARLPRSNHEASLLVIETLFGWVSSSDALARALAA